MPKSTPTPSETYRFDYTVRHMFNETPATVYASSTQEALAKVKDVFERDDSSASIGYNKYTLVRMEEVR